VSGWLRVNHWQNGKGVAALATDKDGKPRGGLFSGASQFLVLLDAEGKPVFTAPPDGDSDQGDGLDYKKVFGGV